MFENKKELFWDFSQLSLDQIENIVGKYFYTYDKNWAKCQIKRLIIQIFIKNQHEMNIKLFMF